MSLFSSDGGSAVAALTVPEIVGDETAVEEGLIERYVGGKNDKEPYDIYIDKHLKLNFKFRKFEGTWWLLGCYFNKKNSMRKYKRIKYIYKWNSDTCEFDIDNYYYTEYPEISCIKTYGIERPGKKKYIVKSGKYIKEESKAKVIDKCHPRKLRLFTTSKSNNTNDNDNNDKNNSDKKEKGKKFYIYRTDYDNFAVIGNPNKKHLWILTREYSVTSLQANRILYEIRKLDYNIEKIISDKSVIRSNK